MQLKDQVNTLEQGKRFYELELKIDIKTKLMD